MIDYGSVCSGIEAATVAVHPLGWKPAWFAEIEAFPSAVLAHHYPHVTNLGDMTQIAREVLAGRVHAPSLLVGGTPCQAFSVAGMRAGLEDARGQLTIKFVELADAIDHVRTARGDDECVVWWENVPGVLSDKGNAFGCFLGALVGESIALEPAGGRWSNAGCVYGPTRAVAWRVLDAQYFGLAQRRRRVFVVASARAGFDPAAVLFEREGVRRDNPPSRGTGQDVTGTLAGGARTSGGYSTDDIPLTTGALTSHAFSGGAGGRPEGAAAGHFLPVTANTLLAGTPKADRGDDKAHAMVNSAVRRLTPRECERLQGFPDDYTRIPMRLYKQRKITDQRPADMWDQVEGGWMLMAADGPRYKAIGNSKAIDCIHWIAERIDAQVRMLQNSNDNNPATAVHLAG